MTHGFCWKKKAKNCSVVGVDCRNRAQSVCSQRCGVKSQRGRKECELSFCRLPTAAAAHRPFIARQRGETSPQQEEKKGGEERKRSSGSKIEKEKKSNQGTEIVQNFTETDEEKRGCIPCRTLENKNNPARGYTKAASPFFFALVQNLKVFTSDLDKQHILTLELQKLLKLFLRN